MSYEHEPSTTIPDSVWAMPKDIPPGEHEGAVKTCEIYRKDDMLATKVIVKADGYDGEVEFFMILVKPGFNKGLARRNRQLTADLVRGHLDEGDRPIAPDGQTLVDALKAAVGAPIRFDFTRKGEFTNLKSIERL
jgi:hypothetical protein